MMLRYWKLLILALLLWPVVQTQYGAAQSQQAKATSATQPGVLKFTPGLTQQTLALLPDSHLIELSNGRRVKLGDIRRMRVQVQNARASAGNRLPAAFLVKPGATGVPLKNSADLASALKTMRDNDTVQLPSGRRVTVAQIKALQPMLEKRLGRKLDSTQPLNLAGLPAIKLAANMTKADLHKIVPPNLSDDTVLESPKGMRVTAGQVRQHFAVMNAAVVSSAKTNPAAMPPGQKLMPPPLPSGQKGRPR